MHPQAFFSARLITVVVTLMFIVLVIVVGDAMVAAGLACDVVTAIGQHLAVLGSLTWYSQRSGNNKCALCADPPHEASASYIAPPLF
jgi:hypothetical protein